MRCREARRSESRAGGLFAALGRLLLSAGEMLSTRIELLSLEARQEALRLMVAAILLQFTVVFAAFALVCASVLLVVTFWESHRLQVLTVLTIVYVLLALGTGLSLRRALRVVPFRASREELRLDLERLEDVARGRRR